MADARVTIHFGSGHQDLIGAVCRELTMAGGVSTGITDEVGLEALREAGLFVEAAPAPRRPDPGEPPPAARLSRYRELAHAVRLERVYEWDEPEERDGPDVYVVTLDGPLFEE